VKKVALIVLVAVLATFFILVDLDPAIDDNNKPGLVSTPDDKDVQEDDEHDGSDETYDDEYDYDDLILGDYVDDRDDYVVQLLKDAIGVNYITFYGFVIVDDEEVYGIGFSPLDTGYESEDGSILFDAGFVPFDNEVAITENMMEVGLEVIDLDSPDTTYLFTIKPEPFIDHAIVDSCYITYGVDDEGIMLYNVEEINYNPNSEEYKKALKSICDTSIGSLFSYDEGRWLYDTSIGEFTGVHSSYILESIDYDAIATELNEILKTQNINALEEIVNSQKYYACEAINAFLLSFQEEKFMGFEVTELVKISEEIDPDQFIRITGDSIEVLDLPQDPTSATGLLRWLTAAGCIILGAAAIAVSLIPGVNVALSVIAGGVIGAALDTISQVAMGVPIDSIDWGRVLISGTVGMICAIPGVSMIADSFISGIGEGIYTLMQGGTIGDAITSFGYGLALGLSIGVMFKQIQKLNHTPNQFKTKKMITVDGTERIQLDDSGTNINLMSERGKIAMKNIFESKNNSSKTGLVSKIKNLTSSIILKHRANCALKILEKNPSMMDGTVLNILKKVKNGELKGCNIVKQIRSDGGHRSISYYVEPDQPISLVNGSSLKLEHISIHSNGTIHSHIKSDGIGPDAINVMYKNNNQMTIEIVDQIQIKDIQYSKGNVEYKLEQAYTTSAKHKVVFKENSPLTEEDLNDFVTHYNDYDVAITNYENKYFAKNKIVEQRDDNGNVIIDEKTGKPKTMKNPRLPEKTKDTSAFWKLNDKEGRWVTGYKEMTDKTYYETLETEPGITNGNPNTIKSSFVNEPTQSSEWYGQYDHGTISLISRANSITTSV